jgi:hypothetical protein
MEAKAPVVVLPYLTDFGRGEGVALLEANLLRPAAVDSVTLYANVAAAVGVPTAMRGISCMHCLRH